MIGNTPPKYPRLLAISLGTRGMGYVVFEGQDILVDWGIKAFGTREDARCLAKVGGMIGRFKPDIVVLEDAAGKDSGRSERIRALSQKVITVAEGCKIEVALFSQTQVRRNFFGDDYGTKYALAGILAKRFPDELGFRLPRERRPWMAEDYRMGIFDALALALSQRIDERRRRAADVSNCAEEGSL